MPPERFSLLLLEPGETYFEDFSAYHGDDIGRLKVCSKSLLFEPRDLYKPLIKIPLKDCIKISENKEKTVPALSVEVKQFVEMLKDNIVAPYIFHSKPKTFVFCLNYVTNIHDILAPVGQLYRASTLPAAEQNSMIATIIYSRQRRVNFDLTELEDFSERTIIELAASKILPLVNNPGSVLLTNRMIYFQPFNNVEKTKVIKIRLTDIRRITKRRFLLRHIGIEIISDSIQLYLAMDTPQDQESLYRAIMAQDLKLEETRQAEMTLQWQNGVISNYDYLLFLNSLADRSFSDLTQYPVFPWVVTDMSSENLDLSNPSVFRDLTKPIGAVNAVRLQRLKERYEEMDPPKFLYGSHYSAPGFVLFYLVRKFPHLMLCLQNGRFDHPDRMFNSMFDVWKNVNNSMADFKELIPEFYDTKGSGEFLINKFGINFGYRHDGAKVEDVQLPPWAQNSPEIFVSKLRDALESEYVSENIQHWIDLIFGYKQIDEAAKKADNVFYPLCYEGGIDISAENDLGKRHALEVQIMEFGQIPVQLFQHPHPSRRKLSPELPLDDKVTIGTWNKENIIRAHRDTISSIVIHGSRIYSAGHDGALKVFNKGQKEAHRSANLSNLALSSCVVLSDGSTVLAGSWDNHIFSYQVEFGRSLQIMKAHDDAVTCLAWQPNILATGSWDCTVRLWRVDDLLGKQKIRTTTASINEIEHTDRISCLHLSSSKLVFGAEDSEVQMWDVETQTLLQNISGHNGKIIGVQFSDDGRRLLTCGEDSVFKLLDLDSGMLIYNKQVEMPISSFCWNEFSLVFGGINGEIKIWDLKKVMELNTILAHQGPVTAVAMDDDVLITGGNDKNLIFWSACDK